MAKKNNIVKREIKRLGAEFWDVNPCGGSWTTYSEFMEWYLQTEPRLFQMLDPYEWSGKKVLEVGCGQGITVNYLARRGAIINGLDMSFQSVRQAQYGAVELGFSELVNLSQADAEQLPFASNTFDLIISLGVLHHTENTIGSIQEIYRILKDNGKIIIMLYRSGNPKWWMTSSLRTFSRFVDFLFGRPNVLLEWFRSRHESDSTSGTALLELFGVPILKAYSNREVLKMFSSFRDVTVMNLMPGFLRLVDILSGLKLFEGLLATVDHVTEQVWGFYQVIEARK